MKKFWTVFTWFIAGWNLVVGVLYLFDGKFEHGIDHVLIAVLFGIILFNQRLIDNALEGWKNALKGWHSANNQVQVLLDELDDPDNYTAPSSYEPYGFGKADQN